MREKLQSSPAKGNSLDSFLILALLTGAFLAIIIALSYKIIVFSGLEFNANSLLCPLLSLFFLWGMEKYAYPQIIKLLNLSLVNIYLFSAIVFFLYSLPSPVNGDSHQAFQLVFQDMPKKSCALGFSFLLGLYIPYLCFMQYASKKRLKNRSKLLLILLSQTCFFCCNFFILFYDSQTNTFYKVFIDSLLINTLFTTTIGVIYLLWDLFSHNENSYKHRSYIDNRYLYMITICSTILLTSISSAYKLVEIQGITLVASGLIFPIIFIVSNLMSHYYGFKSSTLLPLTMVFSLLIFSLFTGLLITLPSPNYLNINTAYTQVFYEIIPYQLLSACIAVIISLILNATFLEKIKLVFTDNHLWLQFLSANLISKTFLCVFNYSILFLGIYPFSTIFEFAWITWSFKVLFCILTLPFVLYLCKQKPGAIA